MQALKSQPRAGAAPRLTEEQQAELLEHLTAGTEAYGFYGDVWTLPRIAIVIKKEFAVQYHSSHVGRLLRRLGWSVQKPVIRATQRDEAAIRAWVEKRWPELKKEAEAAGRTILWIVNRPSTCCPAVYVRGPRVANLRCCACISAATICQ